MKRNLNQNGTSEAELRELLLWAYSHGKHDVSETVFDELLDLKMGTISTNSAPDSSKSVTEDN